MNIYIAPIQPAPHKKGSTARQKARPGAGGGNFQEVLRRVSDDGRGKRDGFSAEPMEHSLRQSDMGMVQRRIYQVNEEILAMMR